MRECVPGQRPGSRDHPNRGPRRRRGRHQRHRGFASTPSARSPNLELAAAQSPGETEPGRGRDGQREQPHQQTEAEADRIAEDRNPLDRAHRAGHAERHNHAPQAEVLAPGRDAAVHRAPSARVAARKEDRHDALEPITPVAALDGAPAPGRLPGAARPAGARPRGWPNGARRQSSRPSCRAASSRGRRRSAPRPRAVHRRPEGGARRSWARCRARGWRR